MEKYNEIKIEFYFVWLYIVQFEASIWIVKEPEPSRSMYSLKWDGEV